MRRFITIGITKTGKVDILHGAEKGFSVHREEFLKLDAGRKKSKASPYAEVQVIDISKGVRKRRRYAPIRVKGMDEAGKRTIARTVKPRKPAKAKKAAPRVKRNTPARRSMRDLTREKTAKPAAAPAKSDAAPAKDTAGS